MLIQPSFREQEDTSLISEDDLNPSLRFLSNFRETNQSRKQSAPLSLKIKNCWSPSTADEENPRKESTEGGVLFHPSPFRTPDLRIMKSRSMLGEIPVFDFHARKTTIFCTAAHRR